MAALVEEEAAAADIGYILTPLEVAAGHSYRIPKHQLAEIAEDTVRCCDKGEYFLDDGTRIVLPIALAVESTYLHLDKAVLPKLALKDARSEPCNVSVALASTLSAAEALVNQGLRTGVLNFPSAKNPGGGFLRGANAQEEALARTTGLDPCLLKPSVQVYYNDNSRDASCVYSDHVIISPVVPVFRRDDGSKLDAPYAVGVITSPAPNMGEASKRECAGGIDRIKEIRRQRMIRVLTLCAHEGFDALVLGAWGCGVFRNDPMEVAQEFKDLLQGSFRGAFPRVVFAVIDDPTHSIFLNVFSGTAQRDRNGTDSANPRHGQGEAKSTSATKTGRKASRWGKHAGGSSCD